MKLFLAIAALVVVAIAAPLLFRPAGNPAAPADGIGLPWQIETLANGDTRVFGLIPGRSTLADARLRLGNDMELAIVAAPEETGSLEAYYATVSAGFITGRMILTLAADPATIMAMRERAPRTQYMDSTTRRVRLHPDDAARSASLPVAAIGFIPSVNVDADTLMQRFGQPAERLRIGEHTEHMLYPRLGLDIVLDRRGKSLFQYVAVRDFARLREPLLAATAAKPAP